MPKFPKKGLTKRQKAWKVIIGGEPTPRQLAHAIDTIYSDSENRDIRMAVTRAIKRVKIKP